MPFVDKPSCRGRSTPCSGPTMKELAEQVYWYDSLTSCQAAACEELQCRLEFQGTLVKGLDDRNTFVRFLRARQWNIDKAEAMYLNMRSWREKAGVDKLYKEFEYPELQAVRTYYPHFYHKTDVFGRPVYYELLGKVKLHKLMETTNLERFLKYHITACESFRCQKLRACSVAFGRDILTTTVILDLDGLGMKHLTPTVQTFMQSIFRIDQDYFPEHLGHMYIINAPFIFRSIWSLVKPLLDERTVKKISFLGSNYQQVLLEAIPSENLPRQYGGSSECSDLTRDVGPWSGWVCPLRMSQDQEKPGGTARDVSGKLSVFVDEADFEDELVKAVNQGLSVQTSIEVVA